LPAPCADAEKKRTWLKKQKTHSSFWGLPMKIINKRLLAFVTLLSLVAGLARSETIVTTYVTKVQEERYSTRFTLTEWLKIKERMRMMDLWLAIFSNPKKDKFTPEVNLSYGVTKGAMIFRNPNQNLIEASAQTGNQGRAQIWLTNLVSGTTGVRTLNIDFGLEGFLRNSGEFAPEIRAQANEEEAKAKGVSLLAVEDGGARELSTNYYTGNLRIFGKNIQDTSLSIKLGKYSSVNNIGDPGVFRANEKQFSGLVAGADLTLYLSKWLGLEGNYLSFGDAKSTSGNTRQKGSYHDYSAFIEISLLRVMIGQYQETWSLSFGENQQNQTMEEKGLTLGSKISF
jgi:hypothetical protein